MSFAIGSLEISQPIRNIDPGDFVVGEYNIVTMSGTYHVDISSLGSDATIILPDTALSNDNNKVSIVLAATSGAYKLLVKTVSDQIIGTFTSQFLARAGTGFTVQSHLADTKYLIVQDSRQLFPSDGVATSIIDATNYRNFTDTSSCVAGLTVTKNVGAGTIDVAEGEVLLRDGYPVTSDTNLKLYRISATAGLLIPDKQACILYVDYNAGSPIVGVTTDTSTINQNTRIAKASIFRNGTTYMDVYAAECTAKDSISAIAARDFYTSPVTYASGSSLSFSSLNPIVSAGAWFSIFSPASTPAVNTTTGGTFTSIYKTSPTTWERTTGVASVDNTNYNDGTTLVPMSANRYAVRYFYWFFNEPARLIMLYGGAQYSTIAAAQAAATSRPSSVPPELLIPVGAVLFASCVVQQGNSTVVNTYNLNTTSFSSTSPTVAASINTSTTNFNGILSTADTTVQQALDTIDNFSTQATATFTNNVYVGLDCSALTFTDRTPYPKTYKVALNSVLSMQKLPNGVYEDNNKENQLDHSKLHPYLRSKATLKDGSVVDTRDMSAAISCLADVCKNQHYQLQRLRLYILLLLLMMCYNLPWEVLYAFISNWRQTF